VEKIGVFKTLQPLGKSFVFVYRAIKLFDDIAGTKGRQGLVS
jgi:hypothetical protein